MLCWRSLEMIRSWKKEWSGSRLKNSVTDSNASQMIHEELMGYSSEGNTEVEEDEGREDSSISCAKELTSCLNQGSFSQVPSAYV